MGRKLAGYVHINSTVYGPDDDVPEDVAKQITNPKAWEGSDPATPSDELLAELHQEAVEASGAPAPAKKTAAKKVAAKKTAKRAAKKAAPAKTAEKPAEQPKTETPPSGDDVL